ncbi:YqeB family protein [Flaviflexus massiliensis]|uniref:YqeB family protein n=1 Tax=Flaviflexus massiliensis TaxID=1522309 RepID=UPI0006D555D8|nr:hypothetical protein [Flaviflexus massiliensis]
MNATRVSLGNRHRLLLGTSLILLGATIGLLIGLLIEYVLSFTSFEGVLGVAAYTGEPIGLAVTVALGIILGLVGTGAIIGESLHAEISDADIHLTWKGASVRVRKDLVSSIHLGTDLVLYCKTGTELARAHTVNPQGLRAALIHHGYPTPSAQQIGDGEFTADLAGLNENQKRIALARSNALRAGNMDIAEILRRQLAAKGIMVRDRKAGRLKTTTEFRRLDPFRPSVLT